MTKMDRLGKLAASDTDISKTAEEKEAERMYGDIIFNNRPELVNHPPLPRESRAAQFSPFSVLEGYEDIIKEAAWQPEMKTQIDEDQKQKINRTLQQLCSGPSGIKIRVDYFQKSLSGKDGTRTSFNGIFLKWDEASNTLILKKGIEINAEDLYDISILDDAYRK